MANLSHSCLTWELLLLLITIIITATEGFKPLIYPNVPELVINEGDSLEITCTSINEIDIHYPETDENLVYITSKHNIIPENLPNGSKKLKFQRLNTVFGDTGYYGCANVQTDITTKDYDDPNASWLYVYVKSNHSAFAQKEQNIIAVPATIGEDAYIDCRPTSPDLHVDLIFQNQTVELDEKISFDPKKGFLIKKLSLSNNGLFKCRIERNGGVSYVQFTIIPFVKPDTKPPIILQDNLQHVTAGSTLRVKCNIVVNANHAHLFEWITPRNSSTRKILPPTQEKLDNEDKLVTSVLVEENVTYDDQGDYTCSAKVNSEWKFSKPVNIHVHDPDVKYINLTSHDQNRHYTINESQQVKFLAYVSGHPQPLLTWLDPSGHQVESSSRISIDSQTSRTTLEIKNIQVTDNGTYSLQANNGAEIKYLNFTLEVYAPPMTLIIPSINTSFYKLNEVASFICTVKASPAPNIIWFYKKCLPPLSNPENNCNNITLKDHVETEVNFANFKSHLEVVTDQSGVLSCSACNILGCEESSMNILVSDGVTEANLGIIAPEEKIVVEDVINVLCTASVYKLSSVQWLFSNKTPIINEERITVSKIDTNFTHQTNLKISNVQKSDEGLYYCKAMDSKNNVEWAEFQLTVYNPEKPYFIESMNNSEQILTLKDIATGRRQLRCLARGLPKPTISWYKDDMPIEANEQFSFPGKHVLEIKFLLTNDSGKYSCKAENRYGHVEAFVKLTITGGFPTKLIIGVVSVIIILLILLIYLFIKIQREKKILKDAGLENFIKGTPDCINPDLTVDDQAELLPYNKNWEFPREKLKLGKQLGSGAFGVVVKAEARGIVADESVTTVAVKMVRRNAEPTYIRALASELKIMVHLGKHLNVVNLLGACTNNIAKRELLVIVEYCRFGNLHNYLLRHRGTFINQINPDTNKIDPSIGKELLKRSTSTSSDNRFAALPLSRSFSATSECNAPGMDTVVYCADTQDVVGISNETFVNSNGSQPGWRSNYRGDYKEKNLKPICTQDLLSWAFQVARGMEYLCQRKVLHGDLAARNILLAENNVVKICDFGLAKTIYKDDNYKKKGNDPVPIKWMAIESIRDHVFSTQSDVWSFGIVLWEFFTLAKMPYPGMQVDEQYRKLIDGYRMEQPQYASEEIYNVMLECWNSVPNLRPKFSELVNIIGKFMEEDIKMHYLKLNLPYVNMNAMNLEGKNDILAMMSSPDYRVLTSSQHTYVNDPPQFSRSSIAKIANADYSDGEDSLMLKKSDEQNRIEIQQSNGISTDNRDSGYFNDPENLNSIQIEDDEIKNQDRRIAKARDNYVNIPQQKADLPKSIPNSFMNPSYIFFEAKETVL